MYQSTYRNFFDFGGQPLEKGYRFKKKRVTYTYDALNRITGATGVATSNYDVSGISYDKNGNITALQRRGHLTHKANTFGIMDDLVYTYDSGNKLLKVTDNSKVFYGFSDGSTFNSTENDYSYDENGNLLKDANKGLVNITYNHLDLPATVTMQQGSSGGTIEYIYDATGTKLAKKSVEKISFFTTPREKLYAGNYVYEGGVLQYFSHPEGYVKVDNGVYNYVYTYKDHLGSVRLSYEDMNKDGIIDPTTEIKEEMNYYPFGIQHKGYNNIFRGSEYPYKFNGKEYDQQLNLQWHDFGARNYDSALGRWMNLDPLTEQMRRHSPYNYAFDNPIFFIDPDGMKPCPNGDCPPEVYNGQGTAVGENVYNQLEEVAIGTPDGVYTNGSKNSFFMDGDMGYGLKANGKGVVKYGNSKGTVEGKIEVGKIGSEGSYEHSRVKGKLEATALKASVSGDLEIGKFKANGVAKGSMWSAETSVDIGVVTDNNGDTVGLVGSLEAGAYAANGSVTGTVNILGYNIGITIGGSVASAHAGLKAKVDTSAENFEVSGYVHAGLGPGFKAGIQITKSKQKVYNKK